MADLNANINVGIETTQALNQLKALQKQISQFHQSVAKSSAQAGIAQRDLQRNFLNGVNSIQGFSAELKTVRTTAESFTNSLEKNKFSMREYFRYSAGATKTFGKNFAAEMSTIERTAIERVKTLQTQYVKMGRDATGAMQAIAIRPTVLNMQDLGTKTAIAAQKQVIFNQLVKQGSTNLLNFGKNTQWAGRQLMVGFTLPLATLGMTAGRVFFDMEKAAIKFKKVYGDLFTAPEETQKAMEDITELGIAYTKYGVAVSDSLNVAADAAAAGFAGVDLQNQTAASLKLSILGQMDLQKSLETTIALQNSFRISSQDLGGTIDFLNAVENQTVVSLDDITEATPRVATVIQALGGDVKDLAFFLAAMKEGGVNAAQGANALKSGLASLINPTERASELLMGMGVNIRAIVSQNQGDLRGTVVGFAEALDKLDPMKRAQAIEQLFGKFQFARISALFDNVIRDGSQASRVLDLAGSSLEELATLSEKELGVQASSSMNKFTSAVEQLKLALVPIGELFVQIATPFVEFGTKMLDAFNALPGGVKTVIGSVITILGGIGPIALMTFGLINNGIANMIKFFATVRLGYLKITGQAQGIGQETQYMTQEQLEAAAAAASLDQAHAGLTQRFTVEKSAVDALRVAYQQAADAGARFALLNPGMMKPGMGTQAKGFARGGVISGPGTGTSDSIPALVSNGEAIIPAKQAKKYAPLIQGMIAGNLPGFAEGTFLGMPRSNKSINKNREIGDEIYQDLLNSKYANTPPTEYGHQISKTTGHSFPIFGLGGVYSKPGGEKVFVKPVLDETAAMAEIRSTQIQRQAHGLESPVQRIVVIRDPLDPTRERRFLALESALDSKFIQNEPKALFNEEQYFRQLVASLVRVDKDLAAGNVFGNVVADIGPGGVFDRASGKRALKTDLPSMEDQALINLLGIKGGAKRAFAESTLGLMAGLTPQQYHQRMLAEINKVLPALKKTVSEFGLSDPTEIKAYDAMIKRLETGLTVDWSKFHALHSAVKPTVPKVPKVAGYAKGVVSVPGPKGKGDVVPAMLSPGEAVIPAKNAKKYAPLINAMIAGQIPGYEEGKKAEFSHVGDRVSVGFKTLFDRIEKFPDLVSSRFFKVLKDGADIFGNAVGVNIYSKLGIMTGTTSQGQSINNQLGKGGVDKSEFMADWDKQGLARWSKSLKYAGLSMEEAQNDLVLLDSGMKEYLLKLDENTKITDKVVKEAYDYSSQSKAANTKVVKSFNLLADTAGEQRINLSQTIASKFGLDAAPGGGSKGAVMLGETKIRKGGDRFPGYSSEGYRVSELDTTKQTKQAAESVVDGVTETIVNSKNDVARATEEMLSPVTKTGPRRASSDPAVMAALSGGSQSQTNSASRSSRRAVRQGDIGMIAAPLMSKRRLGPEEDPTKRAARMTVASEKQSRRMNELSSAVSNTAMSLSAVSGILYMFGGEFANFAGIISVITGGIFALVQVIQTLNQLQIIQTIQTRVAAAIEAFRTTMIAANSAGLAIHTSLLAAASAAMAALLTPLAGIILVVGLVVAGLIGLGFIIKGQMDKMAAFGKIVDITADQIKFLGERAGQKVVTETGFDTATASSQQEANTLDAKQKAEDEEFVAKFQAQIDAAKVGPATAVEDALDLVAYKLSSSGLSDQVVQEAIAGIIRASGRTDINLDFNKLGLSEENTQAAIDSIKNKIQASPASADIGSATATLMQSFALQLEGGIIDLDQYNSKMLELRESLNLIQNDANKSKAINAAVDSLIVDENLKEQIKGVEDLDKRLLLLQASGAVSGQVMDDFIKDANDGGVSTQKLAKTIEEKTAAQREANKITEDAASIEELTEQATTGLEEETTAINNKITAYNLLTQAGYSTEEALSLLNNEILVGQIVQSGSVDSMVDDINKMLSAKKTLDEITNRGGGGSNPIQEAIKGLKEQKQEILNTSAAYSQLRNSGMSAAEAFKFAQNPELMSAMNAGLKVGSAQWTQIIGLIKEAEAATLAWQSSTVEGKTEQFNDVYDRVMDLFSAEEAVLDAAFDSATRTDNRLIESLGEQIDALNRQVDNYSRDLDGIAEQEDAINKAYDEKVKALEQTKKLNDDILRQQKSQLSLADALSQGDIGAAAGIIQESRAANAAAAADAQGDQLGLAREAQLAGVTSKSGLTRVQIEERVKQLKKDISAIEFGALRDAQDRVDAAEKELKAKKEALTVAGKTREEIELAKTAIDVARARAEVYDGELQNALNSVEGIVSGWKSLDTTITTNHVVNTTYTGDRPAAITPAAPALNPETARQRAAVARQRAAEAAAAAARRRNATGGYISGPGTATSDSIPAMLSDGEYVIKAASVNKFGKGFLDSINSGQLPGFKTDGVAKPSYFAGGGMIKAPIPEPAPVQLAGGGKVKKYAAGGIVKPSYFAGGGMVKPSYFSEGGFAKEGISFNTPQYSEMPKNSTLNSISNFNNITEISAPVDNSVYNYSLSVNVAGTDASPDQIANVVMRKLQNVESQRVRGQVVR